MEFKQIFTASAFALAAFGGLAAPSTASAASQDECAIWICLPGGFPAGCGKAEQVHNRREKPGNNKRPQIGHPRQAILIGGTFGHD